MAREKGPPYEGDTFLGQAKDDLFVRNEVDLSGRGPEPGDHASVGLQVGS